MIVASPRARAASRVLTCAVLVGFSLFCLMPVVWMLDTALKPFEEIRSLSPHLLISHPTLAHFVTVLFDTHSGLYVRNSVIVALGTTAVALVVAVFGGYALSGFSGHDVVRGVGKMLIVSQMVPGMLLLVPLYVMIRSLGLLDTFRRWCWPTPRSWCRCAR